MIEMPPAPAIAILLLAMGASALFVYLSAKFFAQKKKPMLAASMNSWVWLHEIPELVFAFFILIDLTFAFAFMRNLYPAFVGLLVFGCALMLYYSLLASGYSRQKAVGWAAAVICAPFILLFSPSVATPLGLSLVTYSPVVASFLVCALVFHRARMGKLLTWGMVGLGIGHELLEAFILHYMGWMVFLGIDPPLNIENVFAVFVVLQVLGAILIWIEARRK